MAEKAEKDGLNWSLLKLAADLGFLIAIPLVLFALAGRVIDNKFGTSPLFFIAGLLLSLFITSIAVYRKIVIIMKETDKQLAQDAKDKVLASGDKAASTEAKK